MGKDDEGIRKQRRTMKGSGSGEAHSFSRIRVSAGEHKKPHNVCYAVKEQSLHMYLSVNSYYSSIIVVKIQY